MTCKLAPIGLALLMLGASMASAQAPQSLTSTKVGEKPTLDGKLDEDLWTVASSSEFTIGMVRLGDLAQGMPTPIDSREAKLYIANDAENLYIGVEIKGDDYDAKFDPNTGLVKVDLFIIQFDTDGNSAASIGDDQKMILSVDNGTFVDQFRVKMQGPDEHADDTQTDGGAAMVHSTRAGDGDYVVEVSIPLDSGDENDIAMGPGQQVGLSMVFADGFNMQNAMNELQLGVVAGPTVDMLLTGTSPYIPLTLAQ